MTGFWKKSAAKAWDAFCKRTGDAIFAGLIAGSFFICQHLPNLLQETAYDRSYDSTFTLSYDNRFAKSAKLDAQYYDSGTYDAQYYDSGSYGIRPIKSPRKN